MALLLDALIESLRRPTAGGVAFELAVFAAPLWLAAIAGLLLGWVWRPRLAADLVSAVAQLKAGDASPSSLPPFSSSFSPSVSSLSLAKSVRPSCGGGIVLAARSSGAADKAVAVTGSSETAESEKLPVTVEDLRHLYRLVEVTDGGPAWIKMMEKSLPNMSYQAWRRDPETGPPQYRSSSIFEDATPEMVRDFFWDDDFRIKNGWDDMLIKFAKLEECQKTGTMVVQWVRKFPFFCSDREYIIGRRIWSSQGAYYCITKGIPYPSVPRQNKPRRVDLYYSSWCIRPAESRRDGRMTACEVLLFHHEDMGIPWEIAKLGVRQGMWGCVKRIEPGLRAYQIARNSNEPPSQSALMAQITTKFDAEQLRSEDASTDSSSEIITVEGDKPKHWAGNVRKLVVVGGAVALACTLDHGLLTKAVIFGVARRFANIGKKNRYEIIVGNQR